ncbi:MAG: KH domain-containing protein [Clostridia bacterium]
MENLALFLAKSLVSNPDSVKVTKTEEPDAIVIRISVPEEEIGKVIGKNGKIANSIRTIIRSSAKKSDKKIIVKIGDK